MNLLLKVVPQQPDWEGLRVLLVKESEDGSSRNTIKMIAIATSAATLAMSLFVLFRFDASNPALQLIDRVDWIPSWGISYFLGIDGLSILMVLLTTFISLLAIIGSWSAIEAQLKQYYIFMLLLEIGMLGVFLAQDLFLFYVFWEFTLVPMYPAARI